MVVATKRTRASQSTSRTVPAALNLRVGLAPERRKMLRYEVESPRATLTIDDPERRNPLSNTTMSEMKDAIDRAAADAGVRVIVITGAGNHAFSAGGDLAGDFIENPIELHTARRALASMFRSMRAAGKPIVARVNGHASGRRVRPGGGRRHCHRGQRSAIRFAGDQCWPLADDDHGRSAKVHSPQGAARADDDGKVDRRL